MAVIQTDALIIGAGPVGLFQAFQLGLQEIRCHIVDALPHVGGQCVELYANKPIYDIPGLVRCSGAELVAQLSEQVKPFAPELHLNQEVTHLTRHDAQHWRIETSAGTVFLSKTVFIAAGVGAFQTRRLAVQGAEVLQGKHLHDRLRPDLQLQGQSVWVLGGEDAAIQASLQLLDLPDAQRPARVTLMHRRDVFQAEPALLQAMHEALAQGRLQLQLGQVAGFDAPQEQLQALHIITPDGQTVRMPAQQVLAFLGVSPKLGPVAQWGLAMERKQLLVNTENFATSEPGIFAVGDINTYPGKKKLIVCGFHEATLAAFGAAALVHPERKTLLQYTTTSSTLHRLLGVA